MERKQMYFTINDLLAISLTLVVAGIGIAYGLQVMGDVKNEMGDTSCAARSDGYIYYNKTNGQCHNQSNGAGVGISKVPVSDEYFNATAESITGVAKIPNKFPTIATVLVASIIIGILVTYLWARFR